MYNSSDILRKIETPSEAWIRLAVSPGDLLVVPAGIYHRFTLDEANNIKALRLFQVSGEQVLIVKHLILANRMSPNGYLIIEVLRPRKTLIAFST
jgi:cupin superfamily acireductone dioxygenase involved in methionine salvage